MIALGGELAVRSGERSHEGEQMMNNLQNAFCRWLQNRTDRKDGAWESATALFNDWKKWAESHQESVGSQRLFSQSLTTRGYSQHRKNISRGFQGIVLKEQVVTGSDASTDLTGHEASSKSFPGLTDFENREKLATPGLDSFDLNEKMKSIKARAGSPDAPMKPNLFGTAARQVEGHDGRSIFGFGRNRRRFQ